MTLAKNREQKLIDLCFEIALMISDTKDDRDGKPLTLYKMPIEKKAKWIAKQLKDNGFSTEPCGSSYGILKY